MKIDNKIEILKRIFEKYVKDNPKENWEDWDKVINKKDLSVCLDAMEEYAKQRSKEFFKWYGVKMMEFLEYFQEKKRNPIPYSIPDAYDKYIEEFEGQSLDNLYELFLKSNELK